MKWLISALVTASVATLAHAADKPVLCTMRGTPVANASEAPSVKMGKRTVTFCCNGCKGAFEKLDNAGKAKAVKVTDLRVEKLLLQQKMEKIDAQIETLTGAAQTSQAGAKLTCAMTGEEIASEAVAGGKSVYNGKTYFFCCAACKTKFDSDPAKYAQK